MIYLQLFLSFLQIGIFSFGGGYAAMPLIEDQVITKHGWLTQADFANLVTIAEMTPGPIAINGATFVGNQVAGICGAVVATAGFVLPSCIFVSILAWVYTRYRKMRLLQGILLFLRPAVIAMILTAGLKILFPALGIGTENFRVLGLTIRQIPVSLADFRLRMAILFIAAFYLLRKKKLDPILVMVLCGGTELLARIILGAFDFRAL